MYQDKRQLQWQTLFVQIYNFFMVPDNTNPRSSSQWNSDNSVQQKHTIFEAFSYFASVHAMLLEKNNQLYFLLNTAKQYCSGSFQVVSRYFEIRWGRTGGWWDNICGRDFWEMPTERNAGAGDEMPYGTFLQAWPFIFWLALRALRTAVPDERCFQSWNPDKKNRWPGDGAPSED